jgi:hypothetical protein
MLKGSLTLFEEDLTCNVRMYDGSRLSPSLTLQGHPDTIGLFGRGYNSSYCFGWSHAGVEIGLIHAGGINLSVSNAAFRGPLIGDLSGATNYLEPLYMGWATNRVLSDIAITNGGTIAVRDTNGAALFSVDGSNGSVRIRNQDSDSRYILANTNWPTFTITNLFRNATNVLYYYRGVVTNQVRL